MNQYTILCKNVIADNVEIAKQTQAFLFSGRESTRIHDVLFGDSQKDIQWRDVEQSDFYDSLVNFLSSPVDISDDGSQDDLAEQIHRAADSIPIEGSVVHFLWFVDYKTIPDISDEMNLFGAMKRLVTWNNADVQIIQCDSESKETTISKHLKDWSDMLHARHLTFDCLKSSQLLQWKGRILIPTAEPVLLQGFYMESLAKSKGLSHLVPSKPDLSSILGSDCAISSTMHVLDCIPSREVPSYFLTSHKFQFCLHSQSDFLQNSRDFLARLSENKHESYIMQLNYGKDWVLMDEVTSKKQNPSVKTLNFTKWQEQACQDEINLTEYLPNIQFKGGASRCHFLVQHDPFCESSYLATLMHRPQDIDGSIQHKLALLRMISPPAHVGEKTEPAIEEELLSLPCFSSTGFLNMMKSLQCVQEEILLKWIEYVKARGDSPNLSSDDLSTILETTRQMFWEKTEKGKIFASESLPGSIHSPVSLILESESNPETWLERKLLHLQEAAKKKLQKNGSGEGLAGLSPPTMGKVLTLKAEEFLKCFKSDGTSSRKSLKSVLLKSPTRRLFKVDSGETHDFSWPACSNYRYHGIYYNTNSKAEILEAKSNKLRNRLVMIETASTFNIGQNRAAPTLKLMSPSPKRKKRKNEIDGKSLQSGFTPRRSRRLSENESPRKLCHRQSPRKLNSLRQGQIKRKLGDDLSENPSVIQAKKKQRLSGSDAQKPLTTHTNNSGKLAVSKASKSPRKVSRSPKKALKSSVAGKESRSQRHKRKLEEVVADTLKKHGVLKSDEIFAACSQRLYMLVKCFVKDLATSHNLRREMENLAADHVTQVITFQRTKTASKK